MKRVIEALNEMCFTLPKGWLVSKDKYQIENGQGFFNRENYVSKQGQVISFFEVHREPEEFLPAYKNLTQSYRESTDSFALEKQFNIKLNGFSFPCFIIKGYQDKVIYNVQVFVNCGDCLGCFMIYIDKVYQSEKETISANPLFVELVKILRTIE